LDPLPETLGTVASVVALFTTGQIKIPATCSANPSVACPGGTPDTNALIRLTQDSLAIASAGSVAGPYTFVAHVAVATVHDVAIDFSGVECTAAIATTASGAPDVRLAGTVTFTSQTAGGPINRLEIAIDSVAGLDAADVTLNGGSLCTQANFPTSFFRGILATSFTAAAYPRCGAPGGTLFEPCPVRTAALSASQPAAAADDSVTVSRGGS